MPKPAHLQHYALLKETPFMSIETIYTYVKYFIKYTVAHKNIPFSFSCITFRRRSSAIAKRPCDASLNNFIKPVQEGLYTDTCSCVNADGVTSDRFAVKVKVK